MCQKLHESADVSRTERQPIHMRCENRSIPIPRVAILHQLNREVDSTMLGRFTAQLIRGHPARRLQFRLPYR
jgi:hypothetical protein